MAALAVGGGKKRAKVTASHLNSPSKSAYYVFFETSMSSVRFLVKKTNIVYVIKVMRGHPVVARFLERNNISIILPFPTNYDQTSLFKQRTMKPLIVHVEFAIFIELNG